MIKVLSTRQNHMVSELANGHTVKEIAARNFLSPYTVDSHLKTSKKKTGARTLAHLAAIYVKSCIALIFLGIQLSLTFGSYDSDVRNPIRPRISRTHKTSRKNQ